MQKKTSDATHSRNDSVSLFFVRRLFSDDIVTIKPLFCLLDPNSRTT